MAYINSLRGATQLDTARRCLPWGPIEARFLMRCVKILVRLRVGAHKSRGENMEIPFSLKSYD